MSTTIDTEFVIETRDVDLFYGQKQALNKISLNFKKKSRNSAYRSVWMWKIYFSSHVESNERSDSKRHNQRRNQSCR